MDRGNHLPLGTVTLVLAQFVQNDFEPLHMLRRHVEAMRRAFKLADFHQSNVFPEQFHGYAYPVQRNSPNALR